LVLGDGGPIAIPPGLVVSINPDGSVFARDPNQPSNVPDQPVGQLGLRDASQVSLVRREDGLFKVVDQPPGSDFATGPELPTVIPQALEGSNVSAIEAMARLLDHSRSFETQMRIIKETKTLDESGSSMIRNS